MTCSRRRRSAPGIAALAAAMLACMTGCEVPGLFLHGLIPEKVEARYKLIDQPTLVLVDDRGSHFTDPSLPSVVAGQIAYVLNENKALSKTNVVSLEQLNALATQLGLKYERTAVDQIGRLLGARQVIHVDVQSVTLQPDLQMLKPLATAYVKVIDVTNRKRLFPTPAATTAEAGSPLAASGPLVAATLPSRTASGLSPGAKPQLQRQLAERLGRDIARLFFTYTLPAERMKDK